MSSLNRVVITGMGALSPAGVGVDALMDAVMAGRSCLSSLPAEVSEEFGVSVVGAIPDYDAQALGLSKKQARRWAKFVQYAAIASDEALCQAGFIPEVGTAAIEKAAEEGSLLAGADAERFACVFGSGIGGLEVFQTESVKLHEKGPRRVSPLFIPTMISNMAAGELAIRYGLHGECTNVVTACATGTQCVGEAYRLIRFGYADAALAGGTEESLSPMALAGFGNLGAITKADDPRQASLPFDARRSGFVAGEGAGALVLESLDHALARGAHIIAEVTGFGASGDGYHPTSPDPSGAGVARAMRAALEEGGFSADDLGHLNAHGTSTAINDATESRALCELLGVGFSDVAVTSTKGVTGHMLGAAGAIEAIVCALSVATDSVPPTAGFAEPDPACPVTVLTRARTGFAQKVALSNSIGFGGHNASLALSPYLDERKEA